MNYDRMSSIRHISNKILKEITGEEILELPTEKLERIGYTFGNLEDFTFI
jgi:hypothetical protein